MEEDGGVKSVNSVFANISVFLFIVKRFLELFHSKTLGNTDRENLRKNPIIFKSCRSGSPCSSGKIHRESCRPESQPCEVDKMHKFIYTTALCRTVLTRNHS